MRAPRVLDSWQWGPALREATASVDAISTVDAFRVVGWPRDLKAEVRMGRELRALGFTHKRRMRTGDRVTWVYCRPASVGDEVAGLTPERLARQAAERARCVALMRRRMDALEHLARDVAAQLQRARPLEVVVRKDLYRQGQSYAGMWRAFEEMIARVEARTVHPDEAVSLLMEQVKRAGHEVHYDASDLPVEWARVRGFHAVR